MAEAFGKDAAVLEEEIKEKESEIESLQTEKELQVGGEMKEVAAEVDDLHKFIVKMESDLKSKTDNLKGEESSLAQVGPSSSTMSLKQNVGCASSRLTRTFPQARSSLAELDDAVFAAQEEEAESKKLASSICLEESNAAVVSAGNELAGAQAGDGRDSSNRSMQERLADAQNAQVGGEVLVAEPMTPLRVSLTFLSL